MRAAPLPLLAAAAARGAPAADEVAALPGWEGALPSRAYAGYVSGGDDVQNATKYTVHSHYLFFESEGDPKRDPVVLWTNGGPGAASFFGAFIELGPFQLSDASVRTAAYNATGVPTLSYNPYSWTKAANLLIMNAPAPVGFSYCDQAGPSSADAGGPGGDAWSCGKWNDSRTATHNYAFISSWFDAFPEFRGNGLYLTGESYAGIYVPTLAREILRGAADIKLRGFAVGDGVLGHGDFGGGGPYFSIEFMHGHGQFSDKLYKRIQRDCPEAELRFGVTSPACKDAVARIDDEVGGYYGYNVYDDCWYENDLGAPAPGGRGGWDASRRRYAGPPPLTGMSAAEPRLTSAVNGYPCGGPHALNVWVNTTEVKAALHVSPDAFYFSGDGFPRGVYLYGEPSLLPFYHEVQADPRIRVLIYNGDTDPGLNSFLAQNWTTALGFPEVEGWRPWTLDGRERMGGYVTRYAGGFDFLTIRGAGHMVPEFKPRAALEFLTRWLRGEDWKRYAPKGRAARRA